MWGTEFQEILENGSFLILIDPQLAQDYGYYRSLPFLLAVCPYNLTVITHRHKAFNEIPLNLTDYFTKTMRNKTEEGIYCIFVKNNVKPSEVDLEYYLESSLPSIVVVNRSGFIPNKWMSSGKAIESKTTIFPKIYENELIKFIRKKGIHNYRLRDSFNLALIEQNALCHYIPNAKTNNILDLFDFENDFLTPTPLWSWIEQICATKPLMNKMDWFSFIFSIWEPYIEQQRHAKIIATKIQRVLSKYAYDPLTLNRNRMKKMKHISKQWKNIYIEIDNDYIKLIYQSITDKYECLSIF